MAHLKKTKETKKLRVLFIERKNDFSSQLAEYYARSLFSDLYDAYSAGAERDIIDCDLLSVMYRRGEDLRSMVSKDLQDTKHLPADAVYDIVIWLDRSLFDEIGSESPWKGRQVIVDIGTRQGLEATDDAELAQCMSDFADKVRAWVEENMADPEHLMSLVSA